MSGVEHEPRHFGKKLKVMDKVRRPDYRRLVFRNVFVKCLQFCHERVSPRKDLNPELLPHHVRRLPVTKSRIGEFRT
jgi:hypothetical protein